MPMDLLFFFLQTKLKSLDPMHDYTARVMGAGFLALGVLCVVVLVTQVAAEVLLPRMDQNVPLVVLFFGESLFTRLALK